MFERLKSLIMEILRDENLPVIEPALREIPFEGKLGLALSNVFQIARGANPDAVGGELKKIATDIADRIAEKLGESGEFDRVESLNGYVNCFFRPDKYARELVSRIFADPENWAKGADKTGKVMIEYSQPNTHKAFHIGHVRNVVTGAALVRCFRFSGKETVAANYYGDIGAHVFKSLWYLEKYESGLRNIPDTISDKGAWLGEIYAKADSRLTESQELKNKVWDLLKPINDGMKDIWENASLVGALEISPLVHRIALREEDLFENRASEEVAEIIGELFKAAILLYEAAVNQNLPGINPDLAGQIDGLKSLIGDDDFKEVWNRHKEVIDVAERYYAGDPKLLLLWETSRSFSLQDFSLIYDELGAEFDINFYESEVESEGQKIVRELEEKGIVTNSKGAMIVEIDKKLHEIFGEPLKDKYRVAVLVRADGASLYGAKDLALAKTKFQDYGIDESIYVVGSEQAFYFQQLFQILRLMGFSQWERCFHLAYELVMLPGGKISSRKGQVILYRDVMDELKQRALKVVNEKNPDLDKKAKEHVAVMIARGALIYGMLRVDTNKKINFDFDEVLDFNGRSAPYIQYACARANSIFRKASEHGTEVPCLICGDDFREKLEPVEIDLIGHIARFPSIVTRVVEDKKPIHLASYAYELAESFSGFYHKCPVLTAENASIVRSRLLLVKAFRYTMERALGLLGIEAPEVM